MSNTSACPHLGLKSDPASYRNYESLHNYCYHCEPNSSINFQHQKEFCLTENHKKCSVFSQPKGCVFPQELVGREVQNSSDHVKWWTRMGLFVLIVVIIIGIYFLFFRGAGKLQTDRSSNLLSLNQEKTFTPEAQQEEVNETKVSPNQMVSSVSPTITFTPTVLPIPTSESVIHVTATLENYTLVIHQIQQGESLVLLAQEHDTSPEAIIDINYGLPTPIWEGWTLVIPDGLKDTNQLPCFEVFFLAQNMSLDEFTAQRNCNKEELKRYNDSISGDMIQGGQWVLIPREKNS